MKSAATIQLVLAQAAAIFLLSSCSAPQSATGGKPNEGESAQDSDFANKGFESSPEANAAGNHRGTQFSRPADINSTATQPDNDQASGVDRGSVIDTPSPQTTSSSPGSPQPTPSQLPSSPNSHPGSASPSPLPGLGSTPSNQCRVATNRLGTGGLGLADQGYDKPHLPFTLIVEVNKSGSTSRCVGIVDSLTAEVFVGKTQRKITFPRIILASHCLRAEANRPITSVTFSEPTTKTTSTMAFKNNNLIAEEKKEPIWVLQKESVKNNKEDPCTIEAKKTEQPTPCFTLHNDRYTLISPTEAEMIKAALVRQKNENKNQFIEYQDLLSHNSKLLDLRLSEKIDNKPTHSESLIEMLPSGNNNNINWPNLFLKSTIRGAKAWEIYRIPSQLYGETNINELSIEQMRTAVYKFFENNLVSLRFTPLLNNEASSPEITLNKTASWEQLITLYISKNSQGFFVLNAIGLTNEALKNINPKFKKGDSGTVILAEFRMIISPLITLRREFSLLGVLSTVAGVPVCEGDDLSCCETK